MGRIYYRLICVITGFLLISGSCLYYKVDFGNLVILGDSFDPARNYQRNILEEQLSSTVATDEAQSEQQKPVVDVIVIRNGSTRLEWIPPGRKAFDECTNLKEYQSCSFELTRNADEMYQADAVLFKAFRVDQDSYTPIERNENQTWIFFETESPFRTWNRFRWYNATIWDKMNMTITYAPDSDIVYEKYGVTCIKTTKKLDPLDYAASKKNAALWVVSNCLSSGRMAYVKELQKHYTVDIYGRCGEGEVCSQLERWTGYSLTNHKCEADFLEKYKFYIAFENCYCKNYYTEKAIKTMAAKTVPVVLGLVNYTQIIGQGTHVNAKDYKSPKELAAHLHELSADDKAYNEIIRKKMQMKCTKNYRSADMLCELCKKLHDRKGQRNILPDMRNKWGVKENCVNPRDFFKGIDGGSMGDFKISSTYGKYGME